MRLQGWVRGFAVVLVCQFFVFATFSSVMPFLPLYLRDLGEDEKGAIAWAGLIQTGSALVLFVATPLWGALSDRVGRKPMLVRALLGGGVSFLAMSLVNQSWQVFLLRMFQGATAGTNSAIVALAASLLPPSRLGMGMGVLQTVQFLGTSLGPMLGGIGSVAIGYRGTFSAAGASILVLVVFVLLAVREPLSRSGPATSGISLRARIAIVGRAPRLRTPILAILLFQSGYAVSMAFLPLDVYGLAGSEADGAALVGLVLTASSIGVATGATLFGWLGGRLGVRRVALVCLGLTALFTVPQGFVREPLQFVPLRALIGFTAGGILPSLRADVGEQAEANPRLRESLGAVYGLAQSAFSGGMAVGPALGSTIAVTWGLPYSHFVSGALLGLTALWYWLQTARARALKRDDPAVQAATAEV